MHKKFYALRLFFISLLLSAGIGNVVHAQTVAIDKYVVNTGNDGSTANRGDLIQYTITVTNNTSSSLTTSTVYANIPLGASYMAGSTQLNNVAVSDVNGNMPFVVVAGGLVNSPSSAAGVIAPGSSAVVTFIVTINFAGGVMTENASFQANNSSGTIAPIISNTASTSVMPDYNCQYIYQSTAIIPTGSPTTYPYRMIKYLDVLTGTDGGIIASYLTGTTYNAITGATIPTALTDVEAMAVEPNTGRIYFVNGPTNNPAKELCYYDFNTNALYKYVGYPLETSTAANYNVAGMTFASDGNGYAITANYQDLIRFTAPGAGTAPTITRLGALMNDASNGSNDITSESNGDMFADAFGRLYLITNSDKLYRIDPSTRITIYLGTISGGVPSAGVNSVAVGRDGNVYMSGAYQTVFKIDLSTMTASSITSGTNQVYRSGDYASCDMPALGPVLHVTKTYMDITTGSTTSVISGDPVEYTITVSNTGSISAGGVKLTDLIPTNATYVANSTTVNGVAVADISGTMPFAAASQYINSATAPAGIIIPGDANKAVMKFRVTTGRDVQVPNQASVSYPDINSSTVTIVSDDPSVIGTQDITQFNSVGARIAVSGILKDDHSVLQWAPTKKADSIAHFEMEYSDDGIHFNTLGKVPVSELENAFNNYQFTDNTNTSFGQRNYRLKIVQENGNTFYSNTVRLHLGASVKVQPNPFIKNITVQVQLNTAEQVQIRLVDFYGRTVYTTTQNLAAGYNSLHLNVPANLAKGVYVLEVSSGSDQLVQKKLIKQ